MPIPAVSESEIKLTSLPFIGSADPTFRKIDHKRFKAKFGVTSVLCARVWNLIVSNLNESQIDLTGYHLLPEHIFYALFFLKCYPTARQTVATLGRDVGLKKFRKYVYFVIRQISALSKQVVSRFLNCD